MTMFTDKLKKLGEHIDAALNGKAEDVAHGEADVVSKETTEAPVTNSTDQSDKINEIHDFLFTDDEDVPLAVVEPVVDVEPEVKVESPEDSKDETAEDTPKWFSKYKEDQDKALKAKDEKIKELKKELSGDGTAVEDPLVHNPEANATKDYGIRKDPKLAPDDPTSAFMHHLTPQ